MYQKLIKIFQIKKNCSIKNPGNGTKKIVLKNLYTKSKKKAYKI